MGSISHDCGVRCIGYSDLAGVLDTQGVRQDGAYRGMYLCYLCGVVYHSGLSGRKGVNGLMEAILFLSLFALTLLWVIVICVRCALKDWDELGLFWFAAAAVAIMLGFVLYMLYGEIAG